jgi:hypothetical protein
MDSERVPIANPSDAAGDRVGIPEALSVVAAAPPTRMALCVSRSDRDYAADVNNSFAAGFQAAAKRNVEDAGTCYKAGYEHGFKNSQACYKAGYLEGNETDGKDLKRKCK